MAMNDTKQKKTHLNAHERMHRVYLRWLQWCVLCVGVGMGWVGCGAPEAPQGTIHRCDFPPQIAPNSQGTFDVHRQALVDCTARKDTGYVKGKAFAITVVTVDGKPVERDTANAYWVMQEAARKAGVSIRIVSGFRTMAQQQYLYNCYLTKKCNNGNLAARPGYSNHQSGHALDLNTSVSSVYNWLTAHGGKYGFKRTVPSEKWHWEWWGGGPGGGPCQTTCKPACVSKSKIKGKDCKVGDCAAFGANCVNDRLGVRCYSVLCPPLGSKSLCHKGQVAVCKDGKVTLTKCSAGKVCATSPKVACVGATQPRGFLDRVDCEGALGWAQDPDSKSTPVLVKLSFGARPGASGAISATAKADRKRADLCQTIGSCNHEFLQPAPLSLLDGKSRPVYATAVDVQKIKDAALTGSPKTLKCKAKIPAGIRRHVVSGTIFAAWSFSRTWHLLTVSTAALETRPKGPAWPAKPILVQADDGSSEVWVVDGVWKRHVQSAAILASWQWPRSAIQKWPASKVAALQKGTPWPAKPFLIKDANAPVYAIDTPQGNAPNPGETGSSEELPTSAEPPVTSPDARGESAPDTVRVDEGNTNPPHADSQAPRTEPGAPQDRDPGIVHILPTLPDGATPGKGCGCSASHPQKPMPILLLLLFFGLLGYRRQ